MLTPATRLLQKRREMDRVEADLTAQKTVRIKLLPPSTMVHALSSVRANHAQTILRLFPNNTVAQYPRTLVWASVLLEKPSSSFRRHFDCGVCHITFFNRGFFKFSSPAVFMYATFTAT
jgi:hypothetical protein